MGFRKNTPSPETKTDIELSDSNNSGEENILIAAKGGGISFAGRIFEYVVRFAFGVLIARVVGVEQYGLYTLAITVSLVGTNISMVGLQTGMVRFLPEKIREGDEKSIWGIIQICFGIPLFVSLFLFLSLLLLAEPITSLLFEDSRMIPLLQLTSILIPLDTISSIAYVLTISYKQPKYSVITNNFLAPIIKLLIASAFLLLGFSTKGIIFAQIIATSISLVVLVYFINILFPLKRKIGNFYGQIKGIVIYSLPVYFGWVVNTLRSTLTTLVLGFLGLTTGVGLYTAASRFSLIGSMFFLAIGNISTPIIADLHSQNNVSQIKDYYQTTARWLFLFNLPVFLTSIFFAEPLLWIFGDDFTSGSVSMMILSFGTLVYTSTGLGANILDMTDHPKVNSINSLVMIFLLIVLNILFIPRLEVIGAALATATSTVLINLISLIEVWLLLGIQPYNRSFLKPIIAGIVSSLFVLSLIKFTNLSYLPQLLLGVSLLWVIYLCMLLVLRLNQEDSLVLNRIISRGKLKLINRNIMAK